MTFPHAAEKVGGGDSGRSRMPTHDRDNFGAERLHPMVTNWRCRPISDIRGHELAALKRPVVSAPFIDLMRATGLPSGMPRSVIETPTSRRWPKAPRRAAARDGTTQRLEDLEGLYRNAMRYW